MSDRKVEFTYCPRLHWKINGDPALYQCPLCGEPLERKYLPKKEPLTEREEDLIASLVDNQITHTKRIGFYKKEIGFKDDKIAKLKKQIIQLQERCDKAEKPSAYVLVEKTWGEIDDNDFIAYFFDYLSTGDHEEDCDSGDIDCRVWRAEKRELTNENGVRTDDMEKLEAVLEKSEIRKQALEEAAALCERIRCREWSPKECAYQIRNQLMKARQNNVETSRSRRHKNR